MASPHYPGRLSSQITNPDVVMMLCTAGHVDHGKTSLVKLLTGCNTDRLKAEQERGMTIELGFAPCFLGNNLCVGIVDVPGHEKFVKNMVAGVSGIGMALLVIAADDGIMPQTIEHFQILDLLGVRKGMIALTKTDLVTPETIASRIAEIREFFRGTFLDGAPICPVSSETFEGYPEFYNTLVAQIEGVAATRREGVFRMPIERVFAREGFGAVVTGIPVAGNIGVGAEIELAPEGRRGRVRGIQRFLRDASEGGAGQCLALNIPELGKKPPARGEVLCLPGYLSGARIFHLDLRTVADVDPPIRNAETVKFHTGTIEASGRLYLLESATLGPGERGFATVVLPEPVAAAPHDRCIVRRPSPAATVAGGEIAAVTPGEHRPRKSVILERLTAHRAFFEGVDPCGAEGRERRVEFFLRWDVAAAANAGEIARGVLLDPAQAREALDSLVAKGRARALAQSSVAGEKSGGEIFIHAETYAACARAAAACIEEAAKNKTLSLGLSDLQGRFDWPAALWQRVLADLEKQGLAVRYGSRLVLQEAVRQMAPADRELLGLILELYKRTGFQSPRPDELPARFNAPPARISTLLNHLYTTGQLIRLDKNVVLHYDHAAKAQELVVRTILEKGSLDSNEFKEQLGTSRKYALGFLDFLDARKITIRSGNARTLASDYRSRLV